MSALMLPPISPTRVTTVPSALSPRKAASTSPRSATIATPPKACSSPRTLCTGQHKGLPPFFVGMSSRGETQLPLPDLNRGSRMHGSRGGFTSTFITGGSCGAPLQLLRYEDNSLEKAGRLGSLQPLVSAREKLRRERRENFALRIKETTAKIEEHKKIQREHRAVMKLHRDRQEEQARAVQLVQSSWRQYRRAAKQEEERQLEVQQRAEAVLKIQRVTRQRFATKLGLHTYPWAAGANATTIQLYYRRHRAQRQLRHKKVQAVLSSLDEHFKTMRQHLSTQAATQIQRAARGMIARIEMQRMKGYPRVRSNMKTWRASVKIQTIWRITRKQRSGLKKRQPKPPVVRGQSRHGSDRHGPIHAAR
mmetsp:Transcript_16994/g.40534  ORF Transcript_16994/g.40534 Transcript_16994/m.40534 type:complete len:364 (-) Transcript_16994:122-1213(-)